MNLGQTGELSNYTPPFEVPGRESVIVVAMSGGVDSSVAALLLNQLGLRTVGISMQVWDYRNNGGCASRATCCAPDDFTDARRVAAGIGIPYYVYDFERVFRESVIDVFVDSYKHGRTPNPCIDCNSKVKFRELRERARAFGGTHIATGHYARIEHRADGYHLLRGVDQDKDQSYFLYGLTQAELGQTIFPVGHLTKPEVRELARASGLATADKPESQDICFVSGKVSDFLVRLGGKTPPGTIVDRSGKIVGTHDGVHRFTVGQRRGIGVGGSDRPLYVLETDPVSNRVVVGEKHELERADFYVQALSWCAPSLCRRAVDHEINLQCMAQVRYRHSGVPVTVTIDRRSPERARVAFDDEWSPVSPGQAAVFYDLENREVLGGGRISRDSNVEDQR